MRTNRHVHATTVDPVPPFRRLRGYAFDPSLSTQLETALINEVVFKLPWEGPGDLAPGPVGEYVEVVDYDPASQCFYAPVDLNATALLAQDGLPPSEGNPQFHQQMVYAVAMTTIRHFERALGRKVLWSPRVRPRGRAGADREEYVPRLRIYPHALREANAYYSPVKKALLFGYFPATPGDAGHQFPGGTVFTCLSHDIVAHETVHAILDGMHRRYIEPTHPDTLAFHEAFADIVALFQHFSFPDVLRHQIARKRGDLASQSLLGELAQEFGRAIGQHGALRDALGRVNPQTKEWEPLPPDPGAYERELEPHARGSILVATIFDAFLSIYRARVADLFRLATSGTGVLPPGAIHPDLVARLCEEAAKAAQHVLNMCVRALDYCPPVDLTFGEYLRAIITADSDLVPDDDRNYRVAFIEAFRRRGIYPRNVRALSEDSLRWQPVAEPGLPASQFAPVAESFKTYLERTLNRRADRAETHALTRALCRQLHRSIQSQPTATLKRFERITGLALTPGKTLPGLALDAQGRPVFEVHTVRPVQRVGPDGTALNQLVLVITQRRELSTDGTAARREGARMNFRGGCSVILDLEHLALRYAVIKRIDSATRLQRQVDFVRDGAALSPGATYFASRWEHEAEPFAMLHRSP